MAPSEHNTVAVNDESAATSTIPVGQGRAAVALPATFSVAASVALTPQAGELVVTVGAADAEKVYAAGLHDPSRPVAIMLTPDSDNAETVTRGTSTGVQVVPPSFVEATSAFAAPDLHAPVAVTARHARVSLIAETITLPCTAAELAAEPALPAEPEADDEPVATGTLPPACCTSELRICRHARPINAASTTSSTASTAAAT